MDRNELMAAIASLRNEVTKAERYLHAAAATEGDRVLHADYHRLHGLCRDLISALAR